MVKTTIHYAGSLKKTTFYSPTMLHSNVEVNYYKAVFKVDKVTQERV